MSINGPFEIIQDTVTKLCKTHKLNSTDLNHETVIESLVDGLGTDSELTVGEWRRDFQPPRGTMYTTFTKKILSLPETLIDGFGRESIIFQNHYMIEVFRIPLRRPCTLANVLTLACYTALISFDLRKDDFPDGIVRAFKNLEMTSLVSYLEDIDKYTEIVEKHELINATETAQEYMLQCLREN